jgi:hypothetical protein
VVHEQAQCDCAAAVDDVFAALGALTRAIGHLVAVLFHGTCHHHHPLSFHVVGMQFTLTTEEGVPLMIIVKDTQPDVTFAIAFNVVDAEGSPVPAPPGLTVETVSDNPSAVAVIPGATDREGSVHFGSPNPDGSPALANITVSVKTADGTLIGSFGEQFTVTAGDPTAIAGGTITFADLTPPPPAG